MGIIYKITNKVNNKSYIGYTINTIEERFKVHIQDSKKYKNRPLYRAFAKYGVGSFTIEVIEEVPDFQLKVKEIICIKAFNTYRKGYNATMGGDGRFTVHNKHEIFQWYINNPDKTAAETARHFKVDLKTVKKVLLSNGCIEIRTVSKEPVKRFRMAVVQLDKQGNTIAEFIDSRKASFAILGHTKGNSHIRDCCKNKRKSAYGFVWKFK